MTLQRSATVVLLAMAVALSACDRSPPPPAASEPDPALLQGGIATAASVMINGTAVSFPPAQLSLPTETNLSRAASVRAALASTESAEAQVAFLFDLPLDLDELRSTGQTTFNYADTGDRDADPAFGLFLDSGSIQLAPKSLKITVNRNDTGGANVSLSGNFRRVGHAASPDVPVTAAFFAIVVTEPK